MVVPSLLFMLILIVTFILHTMQSSKHRLQAELLNTLPSPPENLGGLKTSVKDCYMYCV